MFLLFDLEVFVEFIEQLYLIVDGKVELVEVVFVDDWGLGYSLLHDCKNNFYHDDKRVSRRMNRCRLIIGVGFWGWKRNTMTNSCNASFS